MRTMTTVELRRSLRDPSFLIGNLIMPLALCLVLGNSIPSGLPAGISGLTSYSVCMAVFAAVSAALNATGLRILKERQHGWTTQLRLIPTTPSAYPLAKLVSGAVAGLVPIVLVTGVVTAVTGGEAVTRLPLTVATVWLGTWPWCALGALIGYTAGEVGGQLLILVLNLVPCLLGGVFWPVSSFPAWLRFIADVLPVSHVVAAGHQVQAGAAPAPADVLVPLAYLLVVAAGLAVAVRRGPAARQGQEVPRAGDVTPDSPVDAAGLPAR